MLMKERQEEEPEHLQQRLQNLLRMFRLVLVVAQLTAVTPRVLVHAPATPQNLVLIIGRTTML
jgi:hypothetical protein